MTAATASIHAVAAAIIVILFALVALGLFGFFGFFFLASTSRAQRKAEATADTTLDAVFDGRSDVTYPVNMRTMKPETVIAGAEARGYQLTHQTSNQYGPTALMFRKA